MKGVVFDILRDMIEEQFGLEGWNQLLEKSGSDGMYLSSESYDDGEMLTLLGVACEMTGKDQQSLLREFGRYMVTEFYSRFPVFFDNCSSLFDFLKSVDEIVHVEVLKFYPDANLPQFRYDDHDSQQLIMTYKSPRKLCHLAEGLIEGAAAHYQAPVQVSQGACMHKGDEACDIVIKMSGVVND